MLKNKITSFMYKEIVENNCICKEAEFQAIILIGRDWPLAHLQTQIMPCDDQLTVVSKTPFALVLIDSPHSHRQFNLHATSHQTEAAPDTDSSQT